MEVAVKCLDFLRQDVVARFLAQKEQELADGIVDDLALRDSALAWFLALRRCVGRELQRLN